MARPALEPASTAADLAASISPSLAKRTVAAVVDGTVSYLSAPLPDGAVVELMSRDDPRAARADPPRPRPYFTKAVQALWPGNKTAIGPAIEHGFYYDFEREIIAAKTAFHLRTMVPPRAH
jgi:threonyl-tRNA synthetase